MRRIRPFLLLTLSLLLICSLACFAPKQQRYETVYYDLFDTVTKVVGYAKNESAFLEQAALIHDSLMEYHRLFDIYNLYPDTPNLKTINDNAGGSPTAVDPRVIDLLKFGKEVDEGSGHRVDITLGAVLSLWHECREKALADPSSAVLPSSGALQEASRHVGFDKLVIDETQGTVLLTDPDTSLDVGAIAKGYAAARVMETVPSGYLLSVGGNVTVNGSKPDEEPWSVGIQDPDDPSLLLHALEAEDLSVVTSGDYQRTFVLSGVRYHHIIDPVTLYPADKWRSVTVLCPDSGIADALSTALFLLDRQTGEELLSRYNAEALWVASDGTEYMTSGFSDRITR